MNGDEEISFAEWVGNALRRLRDANGRKISLFNSSVPEPVDLLRDVVTRAFSAGVPASYQSVFMRNHPGLEQLLAGRYNVAPEHVLCTTGASMAVSYVLGALCTAGDHVLIERPGFDIFGDAATRQGLDVSFFTRNSPDFDIQIDRIVAALTKKTRLVVVTDPFNPGGVSLPKGRLELLCRALEGRGVTLLVDEVYGDYTEDFTAGLDPEAFSNLVRIGSLTKNFGLSTLRCGWIFSAGILRKTFRAELDQVDFATSKLTHAISYEVLARASEFDSFRRDIMRDARPIMIAGLRRMAERGLLVSGTRVEGCICFPLLHGIEDTCQFTQWLTENYDVEVVPGECFGEPGHIRIGYAIAAANLKTGLERLELGLAAYREVLAGGQMAATGHRR